MRRLGNPHHTRRTTLTWKQSIFAHRTPRRFKKCNKVWSLLRGSITWFLWKERNEVTFMKQRPNSQKICHLVWLNLIDYGRTAWNKVMEKLKPTCGLSQKKKRSILERFKKIWCRRNVIAKWMDNQPIWLPMPANGVD